MSIYGAMFSGVSGLAAQSRSLGMISDNISNVNTVGYKGSKAQFSTLVTQGATRTSYTPGGVQSTIQNLIDRRFYRRKYNVEKALAAFGVMVREEVDLENLSKALLDVVNETMQPQSISMWLKDEKFTEGSSKS